MADNFETYASGLDSPARNAAAVTPGSSPLAFVSRALYIGGAGDVTVTMRGGGDVTFSGLADGQILPICVTHVLGSSTATGIVTLW